MTLLPSIMLSIEFYFLLCWVSLCWMSLYWVWLNWVSWHPGTNVIKPYRDNLQMLITVLFLSLKHWGIMNYLKNTNINKYYSITLEWQQITEMKFRGLYNKTLRTCNVLQKDRFRTKLVPYIVDHKHTNFYRLRIHNVFIVQASQQPTDKRRLKEQTLWLTFQ